MNFGERLKYLREKEKMYQSELADKLNLAPSTISMYERGDRDPDTSTLAKIAEIFNVTTDYLLGRTDEALLNVKKRMKDNNLHGFFDIGLEKYDELSEEQQKIIIKQLNAMIDIFLEEKDKE